MTVDLYCGDCLEILPTLPAQSVDAVITDPPYPEISRDYGRLTEAQWWDLMMGVCTEVRRILKPTGSAVFILQPNSRKVGSMRGWLWEFMAWVCRDWNMVQDAWWWNTAALPSGGAAPRERGLMRPSLKACVWAGSADCYRDLRAVHRAAGFLMPRIRFGAQSANRPRSHGITRCGEWLATTDDWRSVRLRCGSVGLGWVRQGAIRYGVAGRGVVRCGRVWIITSICNHQRGGQRQRSA